MARTAIAPARTPLLALTLILALGVPAAHAGPITVAWDPNPEPDIAGYVVYVGTQSGVYTTSYDVGNTTTFVFTDAVPGQLYYLAVSAYLPGPIEGPKSHEVSGYGNAPPTLAHPGDQTSVVGQFVTLQLNGSDPLGEPVTYAATGLPPGLTLTPSTGYIQGTGTTAGAYAVTATVSDGVLSASQSFTWTMLPSAEAPPGEDPPVDEGAAPDTVAPTVAITAPSSAPAFTSALMSLTLAGTAADDVGVTAVTWTSDRGGSGTASGTTSWTIGGILLQVGVNVITVTAHDAAGNQGSAVAAVTYIDSEAPTVAMTSPTSASTFATYDASVTLAGTASDNIGVVSVTWTTSTGLSGAAQGTTQWSTGPIVLQPGTNQIIVSAEDAAGNRGSAMLTVSLLSQPALSEVVMLTPEGDAYLTSDPVRRSMSGTAVVSLPELEANSAESELAHFSTFTMTVASSTGNDATADGTTRTAAPRTTTDSATGDGTWSLQASGGFQPTGPIPVDEDTVSEPVPPADTSAPAVTITSPTNEGTYTTADEAVFLVGVAVDDVAVTQVTWATDRGRSGTAEGTSVWSAEIPLEAGTNVMTVTARDAAGNTAAATITVRRE